MHGAISKFSFILLLLGAAGLVATCNSSPKLMAESSIRSVSPHDRPVKQKTATGKPASVAPGTTHGGTAQAPAPVLDEQKCEPAAAEKIPGKRKCEAGKWFATGRWWCTLCNKDGTDFANGGMSVDDNNVCTVDRCDHDQGVVHDPGVGLCPNADICHKGVCREGHCAQDPISCEDGNPCTEDSCHPSEDGCTYLPVSGKCDDGLAITPDDRCLDGICVGLPDPDRDGIQSYGFHDHCETGKTKNCIDNCPMVANPDQTDSDGNGLGDACSTPVQVFRFATDKKVIALTFDDGYNDQSTKELLDTLKAFNAHATFFINGNYIENGALKKPTLERMVHDGHLIANHTFDHSAGNNKNQAVVELTRGDEALDDAVGREMRPYFRSPAFSDAAWLPPAMVQAGYYADFRCNLDPKDWREGLAAADAMVKCLTETAEPGDIILMHAGPRLTVEVLPRVLTALTRRGFSFLTVQDMVYFGELVPRTIQVSKSCDSYYGK